MSGCTGNCNQGRACDCGREEEPEWPPLKSTALAIATVIIAMVALGSIFFTAPWWPIP